MIGGAGYTFPREYIKAYPHARIDVVEIDAQMTAIARRHFGLVDDLRLKSFHQDGRIYLNGADSAQYDAIFIDAFGSLFSIPYHLTTVEAVQQIRRILRDDGVVIVNIGSAFAGPASQFLHAELATYRAVFSDVILFKVRSEKADTDLQNAILVACKSICKDAQFDNSSSENHLLSSLLRRRYTGEPVAETVRIFIDDLAPVEYRMNQALSCCL